MRTAHGTSAEVIKQCKSALALINHKFTAIKEPSFINKSSAGAMIASLLNGAKEDTSARAIAIKAAKIRREAEATFKEAKEKLQEAHEEGCGLAAVAKYLKGECSIVEVPENLITFTKQAHRAIQMGLVSPGVSEEISRNVMSGLSTIDTAFKKLEQLEKAGQVAVTKQSFDLYNRLSTSDGFDAPTKDALTRVAQKANAQYLTHKDLYARKYFSAKELKSSGYEIIEKNVESI